MSLVISQEVIKASGLSEDELLKEIVIMLFQQDKISLGKASELLCINQIRFQRLLSNEEFVFTMMLLSFRKILSI